MKTLLCALFALLLSGSAQDAHELRGRVVFSDGTPVGEATVKASTNCDDLPSGDVHVIHSEEATTAEDGTFSLSVFDPHCNRYRFAASKPSDFWLPSDENVFSGAPPVIRTIDLSAPVSSQPVRIELGVRGGRLEVQVWDIATERFVHAALEVKRKSVPGKSFGSIMTGTGLDGSPYTRLLPPGTYALTIQSYPCGNSEYWTTSGPVNLFVVTPGTLLKGTIRIDARTIAPLPTYDGHPLRKCTA